MSPEMIGVLGFTLMFVMILLGIPIYVCLFIPAMIGFIIIAGPNFAWVQFINGPYNITADYTFAVIPMFILMGILAGESGIAEGAYNMAAKWIGKLRGGLLMATIVANAIFGACSGVPLAANAIFTKIALPELDKYKCNRRISMGVIASAGVLSALIPPSIGMVIFSILTGVSLGRVLIAGIIPGILMIVIMCLSISLMGLFRPQWFPLIDQKFTLREKFASIKLIWPVGALFLLIMGGMFVGVFPSTVAGAIGAFGVVLYALARKVGVRKIGNSFLETTILNAQVFPLIIAGMMFSRFIALSQMPEAVLAWINALDVAPLVVMTVIVFIEILLGLALEAGPILIITLPIVFPLVTALGFDPVAFAVVNIFFGALASASPPVGMQIFIVAAAAKEKPSEVFIGVTPFFIIELIMVFVFILVPQLSTWLPSMIFD